MSSIAEHVAPLSPSPAASRTIDPSTFIEELATFAEFGAPSQRITLPGIDASIPIFVNEFWTAKQRAAHSLHEVSYRACFKPQLPRFFIERLTAPGETVLDPFMGRGTTLLEAALLGRIPIGVDINPLSRILFLPRLSPPTTEAVTTYLDTLPLRFDGSPPEELLVFYHPETLRELCALRAELLRPDNAPNPAAHWVRMTATNRLTGHSNGFFSVYTLPPNQAVSVESQRRINEKRNQVPEYRDVRALIRRKSVSLLADVTESDRAVLSRMRSDTAVHTDSADSLRAVGDESVSLVVTSPPFLDVVQYERDNWLRCWFNDIDARSISIWHVRSPKEWQARMHRVFLQLRRVLRRGGWVAFEVGEVRRGSLLLESLVVPAAIEAGLTPVAIMIQQQAFTKTANCWGVENEAKGTNTNRIVVLRKTA